MNQEHVSTTIWFENSTPPMQAYNLNQGQGLLCTYILLKKYNIDLIYHAIRTNSHCEFGFEVQMHGHYTCHKMHAKAHS